MKKTLIFIGIAVLMTYSNPLYTDITFASELGHLNINNTKIDSLNNPCSPKPINQLVGSFNNEIKVFFSDIDGTLIPFDKTGPKAAVPLSVIEGAKELQKANIPLILVTGRSSGEARVIAQRIGINNQYIIGQQGAEIVDPSGKLIYEEGISENIVKKLVSEVNLFNKKNGATIKPFIYVKNRLYMFEEYDLPYIMDKPIAIKKVSDIGKNFTAIKMGFCYADNSKLKSFQQYLAKKYPDYTIVISADCYCDVSSKKATKGNAVKILSEKLGIDLKNEATIGDTEGDVSMFKQLRNNGGLAIAVDNASKIAKENANYITTSVSNAGFLNAVKNVLINNRLLQTK